MAKTRSQQVPDYLQSFEAFKFGEVLAGQLGRRGSPAPFANIDLESLSFSSLLVLGELVAASLGHPCQPAFWNIYIEEALYRSSFVADKELARDLQTRIAAIDEKQGASDGPQDLIQRLGKRPITAPRMRALYSKKNVNKMYREMRPTRHGSITICDTQFICSDPTAEEALVTASLRENAISSVDVLFFTEPSASSVEAVRILLHRFRGSLTSIRCDGWKLASARVTKTESTVNFWHNVFKELVELENLRFFESYNLGVTSDLAELIFQHFNLIVFRAINERDEPEFVHISKRFKKSIVANLDAKVIDVTGCDFGPRDYQDIFAAMPNLILKVNRRLIEMSS